MCLKVSTYFQTGGLVDAVIAQGVPAPVDIQVSSMDTHVRRMSIAASIASSRCTRCRMSAMS